MKTYTYYWDYEENSLPMDLDEYLTNGGSVLEVNYKIELGKIVLYSAFMNTAAGHFVNFLPVLESLEATKKLKDLAESHQMKLSVGQQYNNYPHLAKTPTVEEQVEMLKLK